MPKLIPLNDKPGLATTTYRDPCPRASNDLFRVVTDLTIGKFPPLREQKRHIAPPECLAYHLLCPKSVLIIEPNILLGGHPMPCHH